MPSPLIVQRMIDASIKRNAGNDFYVDYVNGDDSAPGDWANPIKTLAHALALCVDGHNDNVYIVGDGAATGTARLTAALDWNKDACNLFGITAPSMISHRARISHLAAATANINPLFTVSASGCRFENFSFFQGTGEAATAEQLCNVTGSRNYFHNVHFGGMGAAVSGDSADSYSVLLDGGSENWFDHCTLGLDTQPRTGANATLKFRNSAARNIFESCIFPMNADATAPYFVDANAAFAILSWALFDRCKFLAAQNMAGVALPAVAFVGHVSQNGTLLLDRCMGNNFTDWATDGTLIKLANMEVLTSTTTDTAGMAQNSNAT
ncbi:MAG: hypothetical protein IT443_11885 [Phycisphaeraceae bacterium]|nr:hypothetical protein [Phycisphaeraceae bacterium]